jgi:hypothetical protein
MMRATSVLVVEVELGIRRQLAGGLDVLLDNSSLARQANFLVRVLEVKGLGEAGEVSWISDW